MARIPHHKLKHYLDRPEGELDLHSHTRIEALNELEGFLLRAEDLGWRKVRIITGKGLNSPGGKAVIKEAVALYLRDHNYVFKKAKMNEGGDGVVEVMLT